MIPKLFSSGKSFKKLAAYLLHDAGKAETDHRVKWTHTLNLAADTPALAVDEMLWTWRAADELKREAGIKAGGRRLENAVKHFSLNWHPSETPTREHMIEAVESFLAHMKWREHQALIVCHDDKHAHVHVMLCAVHPETGRALNTSFEKRRAQEWAADYEREHGVIFCDERLKPLAERTPSPTRDSWEKLKSYEREDDRAELERLGNDFDYVPRGDASEHQAREWELLKAYQREQRECFFMEGKEAYRDARNAAYRDVRAEFRERWRGYYEAKREGADSDDLAAMKSGILALQRETLDTRRQEACTALRGERDEDYAALLTRQKEERAELRERQGEGLSSYRLLDRLYPLEHESARGEQGRSGPFAVDERAAVQHVDPEIDGPSREYTGRDEREDAAEQPEIHERFRVRDPVDALGGIGLGALGALASIGERLFDGFLGGGEARPLRRAEPQPSQASDDSNTALKRATAQTEAQTRAAEEADLRAWWDERRARRRERD